MNTKLWEIICKVFIVFLHVTAIIILLCFLLVVLTLVTVILM